jgi:hypothetical protein
MNPTIHNAAITNWVTDLGKDGISFYTLAKYWTKHHNQEDWEIEGDLEFFLECRSYTGPAPQTRNEYKIQLTCGQYAYLLYTVENSGPVVVHNYIERKRPSWLDTPSTSVT